MEKIGCLPHLHGISSIGACSYITNAQSCINYMPENKPKKRKIIVRKIRDSALEAIRYNHGDEAYYNSKHLQQEAFEYEKRYEETGIEDYLKKAEAIWRLLNYRASHKSIPIDCLGDEIDEEDARQ